MTGAEREELAEHFMDALDEAEKQEGVPTVPDLDAIRARFDEAVLPPESASNADLREIFAASARDVPALLAEVERLRAQRDAALALPMWRGDDGVAWVHPDELRRALGVTTP